MERTRVTPRSEVLKELSESPFEKTLGRGVGGTGSLTMDYTRLNNQLRVKRIELLEKGVEDPKVYEALDKAIRRVRHYQTLSLTKAGGILEAAQSFKIAEGTLTKVDDEIERIIRRQFAGKLTPKAKSKYAKKLAKLKIDRQKILNQLYHAEGESPIVSFLVSTFFSNKFSGASLDTAGVSSVASLAYEYGYASVMSKSLLKTGAYARDMVRDSFVQTKNRYFTKGGYKQILGELTGETASKDRLDLAKTAARSKTGKVLTATANLPLQAMREIDHAVSAMSSRIAKTTSLMEMVDRLSKKGYKEKEILKYFDDVVSGKKFDYELIADYSSKVEVAKDRILFRSGDTGEFSNPLLRLGYGFTEAARQLKSSPHLSNRMAGHILFPFTRSAVSGFEALWRNSLLSVGQKGESRSRQVFGTAVGIGALVGTSYTDAFSIKAVPYGEKGKARSFGYEEGIDIAGVGFVPFRKLGIPGYLIQKTASIMDGINYYSDNDDETSDVLFNSLGRVSEFIAINEVLGFTFFNTMAFLADPERTATSKSSFIADLASDFIPYKGVYKRAERVFGVGQESGSTLDNMRDILGDLEDNLIDEERVDMFGVPLTRGEETLQFKEETNFLASIPQYALNVWNPNRKGERPKLRKSLEFLMESDAFARGQRIKLGNDQYIHPDVIDKDLKTTISRPSRNSLIATGEVRELSDKAYNSKLKMIGLDTDYIERASTYYEDYLDGLSSDNAKVREYLRSARQGAKRNRLTFNERYFRQTFLQKMGIRINKEGGMRLHDILDSIAGMSVRSTESRYINRSVFGLSRANIDAFKRSPKLDHLSDEDKARLAVRLAKTHYMIKVYRLMNDITSKIMKYHPENVNASIKKLLEE